MAIGSDGTDGFSSLIEITGIHDHDMANFKAKTGCPLLIKSILQPAIGNLSLKPKALLRMLREGNDIGNKYLTSSMCEKIKQWAIRERRILNGPFDDYGSLIVWCRDNLHDTVKDLEDFDEHTTFVLKYYVDGPSKTVRIILTTMKLVTNLYLSQTVMPFGGFFAIDPTWKKNANGFPVTPCATMDASGKLHFGCIAVTSDETSLTMQWYINAVMDFIQTWCGRWAPSGTMTDHDDGLDRAIIACFSDDVKRGDCYVHLLRNGERKRRAAKIDIGVWRTFLAYLSHASSAHHAVLGDMIIRLVTERFAAHPALVAVVDALFREYAQPGRQGWRRCNMNEGHPLTNNAQEGKQNDIKLNMNFGERRALIPSLEGSVRYMTDESRRDPLMSEEPNITNRTWRAAQILIEQGYGNFVARKSAGKWHVLSEDAWRIVMEVMQNDENEGRDARDKAAEIIQGHKSSIAALPTATVHNMDALIAAYFSAYEMILLPTSTQTRLLKYHCFCPMFGTNLNCKHSLAWAIIKGDISVPKEKDITRIGKKPKRGRPRKAASALERQFD